jgi:hypothetical protein
MTRRFCASLTFLKLLSFNSLLTGSRRGAHGSRARRPHVHTTSVIDRRKLLLTAERLPKFRAHSNLATKIVQCSYFIDLYPELKWMLLTGENRIIPNPNSKESLKNTSKGEWYNITQ